MIEDSKVSYELQIPFKNFLPGTYIKTEQFNDDFNEIESKINEIILKFNLNVNHAYDHDNPHNVTAEQVGSYTIEQVDKLFDGLFVDKLPDKCLDNRLFKDGSVDSRVLADKSVALKHLQQEVKNYIDTTGSKFPYAEISSETGSIGEVSSSSIVNKAIVGEAIVKGVEGSNEVTVTSQPLLYSLDVLADSSEGGIETGDPVPASHYWVNGEVITDVLLNSIEGRILSNTLLVNNMVNDVDTHEYEISRLKATIEEMKAKLDTIEEHANNYVHPATHPASIIVEDNEHKFVTSAQIEQWNSKPSTGGSGSGGSTGGGGSTEPDTPGTPSTPIETVEFPVPCNGVDVSRWQGDMNFTAIKDAGDVKFVIIRIGYGSRTGGTPGLDPKFTTYLNDCIANDIPVGVYFFSYANTVARAQKEADWVIEQLAKYPKTFEFPVFFDQEYDSLNTKYNSSTGKYTTYNPGKTALTNIMNAFCQRINDAGYMSGIYINNDWATNYVNWADVKFKQHIWVAQWSSKLTWTKSDVKVWQKAVTQITGHTGDIDYDQCFFDYPNYVRQNHLHGF